MSTGQAHNVSQAENREAPVIEDPNHGWYTMLDQWARYQWQRFSDHRDTDEWPPPWAPAALAIAALILLVLLIGGLIVPLVRAIAHGITAAADAGSEWLTHWTGARLVLDPIHRYLDTHAAGLPVTASTLWWTWCATGISLFHPRGAVPGQRRPSRLGAVRHRVHGDGLDRQHRPEPAHRRRHRGAVVDHAVTVRLRSSTRTLRVRAYLPQLPELASALQRRSGA